MALSQYEVAATECQDEVASQDAATIERAAGHADAGTRDLSRVTERINAIADAVPRLR
jgi:hypothetical protein